jgi:hypothetical protein
MARLHLNLLAEQFTPNRVRAALQRLPDELDGVYKVSMERISQQKGDRPKVANAVLKWITYARTPRS